MKRSCHADPRRYVGDTCEVRRRCCWAMWHTEVVQDMKCVKIGDIPIDELSKGKLLMFHLDTGQLEVVTLIYLLREIALHIDESIVVLLE